MSFILLANFKSHQTLSDFQTWVEAVCPHIPPSLPGVIPIIAPSFVHLSHAQAISPLKLCAQDVSPFPPGSYTGSVNSHELVDLHVDYCLVGHSERRRYFHETPSDIANKIRELHNSGITPVLCLSRADLSAQLPALDDVDKQNLLVAYEPPADIGGTETAPLADIQSFVTTLRELFPACPILYGGSVNPDNLTSLFGLVDGALIATASLKASSFLACLNQAITHGTTR